MDYTQLIGTFMFVGGAHALWWKYGSLREGKSYRHSYTEWFLENREKHQSNLLPFDERLVEIDFFNQELPEPGEEPSIVVDMEALMAPSIKPEWVDPDVDMDLMLPSIDLVQGREPPPLDLPKLGELTHEQAIKAVKLQADLGLDENDIICDVSVSDMDDEPSIVIDYAALGLATTERAIVLDDNMDDGQLAMDVVVDDIRRVYREPEQMALGF